MKDKQRFNLTDGTLSLKEKVGYGFGDAASSMFWKMFSMYLVFFYTDIFGISAAAVGTMFLFTRIWDAANDGIMGVIADRTTTRWGKFRPYLLWMAIPFAVIGVITFTTPDLGIQGKLIYAYITYTIMMMVYTAINVPYASLIGVMTPNSHERTSLASYRMVFAFIGSIIVLGSAEPLVDYLSQISDGPQSSAKAWQYSMIIYGIIAVVLFYLTFAWTKERVKPIKEEKTPLKRDLKDLMGNKPWFILLGAGIATLIFNSLRDGSTIYYFKYFISNQKAIQLSSLNIAINYSTLYLVLGQMANILGVILARPVSDRLGKKYTFFIAMILASVLSIIFFWLTSGQLVLIFVLQFLISTCAGIIFPLLWSMFADIADYSEWKTGRRATGLIFSSSSMSQKMGWTLGGALTGWMLAMYGFQANVIQTEESLTGIRLMMSIFPALGALISGILIYFYTLNDQFIHKINQELSIRRLNSNDNKG